MSAANLAESRAVLNKDAALAARQRRSVLRLRGQRLLSMKRKQELGKPFKMQQKLPPIPIG
jgi:hypothetical protein